ncbi:FAD-binding domain-containing protein [Hypoxylon trugodes]|uniref:FAD-binding domain-containing protein n=1 Tax=Hypoxylon trugodes TaxID=326681 RepID=UPI002194440D|nr:FAD-binding domain-containing protein [Hypoxylon trugodes]KAI1393360.1 FAD-binding domain-containing protein [Hypoxylon trugodes]
MRFSPILFVASILLTTHTVLGATCRCSPSEPCWPTTADWESFNKTIGGALIKTTPPGSVCYPSEPNYSAEACEGVISNWTADNFHSSDPISVSSSWTNDTCDPIYPNGTSIYGDESAGQKGCSLGALPEYIVDVTDSSQIQAALMFAKERNLRINIKNTGHNGAGRNTAAGSLSLWTHNLKNIVYHEIFQPQGCSSNTSWKGSQKAVTIGAGIQGSDLYPFFWANNIVVVTGTSTDVGVVGWATGGGHGFLTGEYGMGADNILEATIVTPAGDVITANSCHNSDLLWAIRGGGGGTFGVIVNMTMKAYPVPSLTLLGLNIAAKNGTSSKAWWKVIAQLNGVFSDIQQQGYYTIGGPPSSSTLNLASSLFFWNKSNATAQSIAAPIRRLLSAANGTVNFTLAELPVTSIFDLVKMYPSGGSLSRSITASRLITKRAVKEQPDLFAQTLEVVGSQAPAPSDGTPNPGISGIMTIGHESVNNSLNPAWRDTVVHLITEQSWGGSMPASNVSRIVNEMTYGKLNALRGLAPESGAYLNEANIFEPGWQWSFYGPNYARLREIKREYDPEGLLWCRQCVGSEDWVQNEDGRLCQAYQPF